jgi:farnesyl diphosphate synthase
MATTVRNDLPLEVWMRERQRRVEDALVRALDTIADPVAELDAAMRYATLEGGKRIRPLLAYAAGELAGGNAAIVDAPAVAVELIHAYSLAHDDLPSMDNDTLRRGKPSCHVAFGEATALLAGDALQTLAFSILGTSRMREPGVACALLADAAGAGGMAGGQALDLAATGTKLAISDLERLHRKKTGALIGAAIMLGARCGRALDAAEVRALDAFALAAGLAFQVVDDILDVEGSAASLGKSAGKDAQQNKPTYVSVLGLDAAKRHAVELTEAAHAALATFGADARRLEELADLLVRRKH